MSIFISSRVSRALVLALVAPACGGGTQVSATANNASNASNIAANATEPRANDATASAPAPSAPVAGVSANLSNPSPPEPAAGPSSTTSKTAASPPSKISARHVLIQYMGAERAEPSVVRSREQALAVAKDVLRRAKAGDDFARLAIEFSDEPGAGPRGGSLGRFGHGQMVPAFEAVAFKLGVGEISDIVETPFGFHVIQRTE